ncbi:hypothetical protein [Aeromonas phage JELG-KS1]|uniref:Uncharacterized protein n=1 Tax=Aeromonas phage JELG-KS1 TaxID=2951233 RepID=A0A9E7T0Y5_9CAUD|nr:hypothetical protein [Aeromonas phage JELG-KS1]
MRKLLTVGRIGLSAMLTGCHDPQPQLPAPVQKVFDKDGNPITMPQAGDDSGFSGTEMLMGAAAGALVGNMMGKSSASSKAPRTVVRETTIIQKVAKPKPSWQPKKPNYMSQPRKPPSKFTSGSTFKSSTRSFSSGRRR